MPIRLDLDKFSYDGQWYDFKDGRLKIRPFPRSMENNTLSRDGIVVRGEDAFEKFSYCLVDWEGVTGANDAPLALTPNVKKVVFDSGMGGIPAFVLKKVAELDAEWESDQKN